MYKKISYKKNWKINKQRKKERKKMQLEVNEGFFHCRYFYNKNSLQMNARNIQNKKLMSI